MVKFKLANYDRKEPDFGIITENGKLTTYAKIECMLNIYSSINTCQSVREVISNCIPTEYIKGLPEKIVNEKEIEEIAKKLYDENEKEKMENDVKVIMEIFRPRLKMDIINKSFKNVDKRAKYYQFVKIEPLDMEEFKLILKVLSVGNLSSEKAFELYSLVLENIFIPEKWEEPFLKEGVLIKPEFDMIPDNIDLSDFFDELEGDKDASNS